MTHELIKPAAQIPLRGVRLFSGVLQQAYSDNITYLKGLSQDSILYWFRIKAGLPAPGKPYHEIQDEVFSCYPVIGV